MDTPVGSKKQAKLIEWGAFWMACLVPFIFDVRGILNKPNEGGALLLLLGCAGCLSFGEILSFPFGSKQSKFAATASLAIGSLYPISVFASRESYWSSAHTTITLACICIAIYIRIGWNPPSPKRPSSIAGHPDEHDPRLR